MNSGERIQNCYPWVEECFIETDDFHVQCRNLSCQSSKGRFKYVELKNAKFKNHIRDTHPDWYMYEERMAKNKDWKYFRLTIDKKKACILCDIAGKKFSQNENLSEHLKNHSKLEQNLGRNKHEAWYWKYLEQTEDYSAKLQCKICGEKITYVKSESIEIHMQKEHPLIAEEERPKHEARNIYWQHLRFTDALLSGIQCMKCFQLIRSDEAKIHVQHHFTDGVELGTRTHWTCKYARQNADSVTCKICEKTLTLSARTTQLKRHIHDCHNEVLMTIAKENLLWIQLISEQWKWLEKYYINVVNFRAECKLCKYKIPYIKHEQFKKHIQDNHSVVKNLEDAKETNFATNLNISKAQWDYKIYLHDTTLKKSNIGCMICNNKLLNHNHTSHVITNHDPHELLFDSHWALKYAIQNGQVASCVLCKDEVNFKWAPENLENHMTSVHPEKRKQIRQIDLVQGTVHDQATPSTSYAS
nr:PREDICTED: uncharacterized protein LOC105678257 [Linepithema humile]